MSLMAINRGFKKYGTVFGAILAFILIVGVVLLVLLRKKKPPPDEDEDRPRRARRV